MLKAIRYTLAAICLAASVGCLALWWRSCSSMDQLLGPCHVPGRSIYAESCTGYVSIGLMDELWGWGWQYRAVALSASDRKSQAEWVRRYGQFGLSWPIQVVVFPLWYPALVFALVAVAAIRMRRFTLRSALVGIGIVAALLGMAVAL